MSDYSKKLKYYLKDTCKNITDLKIAFERITYNLAKYIDFIDKEVITKFKDSYRDDKLRMLIETLISGIHDSLTDINYNIKPPFMFYLQKYTNQLLNIVDLENLLISENVKDAFKQIIVEELNSDSITINVEKSNYENIIFSINLDIEAVYITEDIRLNLRKYLVRAISINFDKADNDIEINFSVDDTDSLVINGIIYIEPETEPDIIGNANVPTYDIGFGGNYSYRMNIANSNNSPWYEIGNLPVISPIKFNMKKSILNNLNFKGSNSTEAGFINAFGDVIFYIPGIQILYDPIKITLKIRLSNITKLNTSSLKNDKFKYILSNDGKVEWFTSEWTPYINDINNIGLILQDDNDRFHLTDEEIALEQKLRMQWNDMSESLTNNNDMHYLLANLSNYISQLDKYIDFIQKRRFVIN